jgi:hypothetical protein
MAKKKIASAEPPKKAPAKDNRPAQPSPVSSEPFVGGGKGAVSISQANAIGSSKSHENPIL